MQVFSRPINVTRLARFVLNSYVIMVSQNFGFTSSMSYSCLYIQYLILWRLSNAIPSTLHMLFL